MTGVRVGVLPSRFVVDQVDELGEVTGEHLANTAVQVFRELPFDRDGLAEWLTTRSLRTQHGRFSRVRK